MTVSKPTAAILAISLFAIGVTLGYSVATPDPHAITALPAGTPEQSPGSETIADMERELQALEREYDAAMASLYSGTKPPGYRPAPEMQEGLRGVIELNEMICKQTGQNCETATMTRRHYEETYGPLP